MSANATTPQDVIGFWSSDEARARWWVKDEAFDQVCRERFGPAVEKALEGGVQDWTGTPEGSLALLILLDQLTRNLFRGTAKAFAGDERARAVARRAVARGQDKQTPIDLRLFFYLPFEHSEAWADQLWSVALFEALGDPTYLDFALRHRDVIERFGRYPHRNQALGRPSTPEEEEYLAQPGAGF